jgi:hypothetical protein
MNKVLRAGIIALCTVLGTATAAFPADLMTWDRYWKMHPTQGKITKPVRWTFWHTGGRQVVNYAIKPTFGAYTAWGQFSEQSGLTRANAATGTALQMGTMVLLGIEAGRK